MDRLIQECALFISGSPSDLYRAYVRNLSYWKEQRLFLSAVVRNDLMLVLLRHCMDHVYREEKQLRNTMDHPEVSVDEDVLLFFVTGQVALLLKWAMEDFSTSVEVLAEKMVRLLHTPLIPTI